MGSGDDAGRNKGEKERVEPQHQNKKMLKSRGKSQDVVENKGQKKFGYAKTQDVIENKGVTRLTRDVDENKRLNIKSGVNCALEWHTKAHNWRRIARSKRV